MPSKSQAQFGWAGAAYRRGDISRKMLRHFNKGVKPGSLPKRVRRPASPKRLRRARVLRKMLRRRGGR